MGGISAHKGIEKGINKGGEGPPRPQFQVSDESDEAWLARVRQDWPGVDIEAELAKARRKKPEGVERGWFERHWLPGCSPKVGSAVTTPKPATDHPARWREVLDALYPGNAVSSDPSRSWASLPPERKTDVINYIEQNGSGRSASTQRNGRFFAQNGAGTRSFDKHGEGAA
ncbi:MAG: hypothetical protein QG602_424 [Verrucomicrobiota bacterium]|nr:hypothetical protein [Verrucomicrobiota bacterium]